MVTPNNPQYPPPLFNVISHYPPPKVPQEGSIGFKVAFVIAELTKRANTNRMAFNCL